MAAKASSIGGVIASDRDTLLSAVRGGQPEILVSGRIPDLPPISLRPGQRLLGERPDTTLVFKGDGLGLNADNAIEGLSLVAPSSCRSVWSVPGASGGSALRLRDLVCNGRVEIDLMAADGVFVTVVGVGIAGADTSSTAYPAMTARGPLAIGAFSALNRSLAGTTMNLDVRGLSVGMANLPVVGSGVVLAGAGDGDARIAVSSLDMGPIHIDSGFDQTGCGTSAAGVCVGQRVSVSKMRVAACATVGADAISFLNLGEIEECGVDGDLLSRGAGAFALLNVGRITIVDVRGVIETHGTAAHACEILSPVGTLRTTAVRTHGGRAAGVRIASDLDALELSEGVYTDGGRDVGAIDAMERSDGVQILPGGRLGRLVALRLEARGQGVLPLRNHGTFGR